MIFQFPHLVQLSGAPVEAAEVGDPLEELERGGLIRVREQYGAVARCVAIKVIKAADYRGFAVSHVAIKHR
jgi:hypothetical protein